MTREKFIIYLMSTQGMDLKAAEAEADKQFASAPVPVVATPADPKAPVLTEAAKKAIKVEDDWDNQIINHESEAQNAVYTGSLRRIRRLVQEKLKARKFFDRAKMYM